MNSRQHDKQPQASPLSPSIWVFPCVQSHTAQKFSTCLAPNCQDILISKRDLSRMCFREWDWKYLFPQGHKPQTSHMRYRHDTSHMATGSPCTYALHMYTYAQTHRRAHTHTHKQAQRHTMNSRPHLKLSWRPPQMGSCWVLETGRFLHSSSKTWLVWVSGLSNRIKLKSETNLTH